MRPISGPLAAVVVASVTACARAPMPSGPPPLTVTTGHVVRGSIATLVSFDGQITPLYQTTLATAESGTIASIPVTEGDYVRSGQVLATLDTSQLQAQLAANAATLRQQEAQLTRSAVAAPINSEQYHSAVTTAQQNLQSANNAVRSARAALARDALTQTADLDLLRQQFVSRTTYQAARAGFVSSRESLRSSLQAVPAAEAALRTALSNTDQRQEDQATIAGNRGAVDTARANVDLLQAQIAQSSIVAPFDGQVTERFLDPGAYAGAATAILEISQVSTVYVVANVPDVDLPYVSQGVPLTFRTTSLPGRTFSGRVFDVNTTPTSGTLSYRVRLLEPNADLALRSGMMVDVTATRAKHDNVLLVPAGAVVGDAGPPSVYVVVGGKAKHVAVRLGLQTDSLVEVRGPGLAPGDVVITAIPSGLRDGTVVMTPEESGAAPRRPAGK